MKAIYFDFFGVISTPVYWTAIKSFLPEDVHVTWYDKLNLLDTGEIAETQFVTDIANASDVSFEVIWKAVGEAPKLNTELLEYIQDNLLGRLKVGLLTNIPRSLLERVFGEHLPVFDPVIVSSDVRLVKPDPRIFELAIERLGIPASDVTLIDDSERNVVEAVRHGINSFQYIDNPTLFEYLESRR